jgi:uncharacterized RDD family membrane protein YckC
MFCSKCGANVAEGTAFCSSCGMPVAGYSVGGQAGGAAPPPAGGYAPATAAPGGYAPGYAAARPTVTYAGFWLRVVAAIIDGLVLAVPMVPIYLITFASLIPQFMNHGDEFGRNPFALVSAMLPRLMFIRFVTILLMWLYWSLLESSSWQATLGKKALGLSVVDLQGRRISFGRATGRFFAGRGAPLFPYLGALYFFISSICAGFTEKKQALSDMIAGCLVIRKI